MTGDEVIAKILKAEGVEWLSCFPAQTLIDAASSVKVEALNRALVIAVGIDSPA